MSAPALPVGGGQPEYEGPPGAGTLAARVRKLLRRGPLPPADGEVSSRASTRSQEATLWVRPATTNVVAEGTYRQE